MKTHKLVFISITLLIIGVMIGFGIAKYNQQRHVIPNIQTSENAGYGHVYPQSAKVNRTINRNSSRDLDKNTTTYQYMQHIYRTLDAEPSTQNLIQLLKEIETDTNVERKFRAILAVIEKFASIDPTLALHHIPSMNTDRKEELVKGLFEAWSIQDSQSAIDVAMTLSAGLRKSASAAILKQCRQTDICSYSDVYRYLDQDQFLSVTSIETTILGDAQQIADLWRHEVSSSKNLFEKRRILESLAEKWVAVSGLLALDKIDKTLSNPQLKFDILAIALQVHAKTNPKESIEFALNLPHSADLDEVLVDILQARIITDPVSTFEMLASVDQIGRRRELERSVIQAWANVRPYSLLEYSELLHGEVRFGARSSALLKITEKDPVAALQLAENTTNNVYKMRVLEDLLSVWAKDDAVSALNWLINHEQYQHEVELLRSVIREYSRYYPGKALDLTQDLDPMKKIAVQNEVIRSVSETDPLHARDMLTQMDEASGMVSAHTVGMALVRHGYPLEALSVIDNISEGQMQEMFYVNIVNQWLRYDPIDLYSKLSDITDKKVASKCAYALIRHNEFSQTFDEAEIAEITSFVLPENQDEMNVWDLPRHPSEGKIILHLDPQ